MARYKIFTPPEPSDLIMDGEDEQLRPALEELQKWAQDVTHILDDLNIRSGKQTTDTRTIITNEVAADLENYLELVGETSDVTGGQFNMTTSKQITAEQLTSTDELDVTAKGTLGYVNVTNIANGYQIAGTTVLTYNGDNNLLLGPFAGIDETGEHKFIVDDRDRTTHDSTVKKALLYGVMAATEDLQSLRINAPSLTLATDLIDDAVFYMITRGIDLTMHWDGSNNNTFEIFSSEFDPGVTEFLFSVAGHVVIGAGLAGVDYTLTFDGETNDCAITYDEDNNILDFGDTTLSTGGGHVSNVTRVTSTPYDVLPTDHIIFVDTDGGAIEADLRAGVPGRHYKIINCGSSGNDLTVDPNGTEQLYGAGAGVASTLADGEVINIHYETTEGWW